MPAIHRRAAAQKGCVGAWTKNACHVAVPSLAAATPEPGPMWCDRKGCMHRVPEGGNVWDG